MLSASSPAESGIVLTADVEPSGADELIGVLDELGVGAGDYRLTRLDIVAPITPERVQVAGSGQFAWLEVLGEATVHAHALGRYLVMMAIAGIIAALGVTESNSVLIVGAMAVSPDLQPVCALSVGIVGRRWRLVETAASTLAAGLILSAVTAGMLTFLLVELGLLDADFVVTTSSISGLAAETDYATVIVALAAGVVAMIAFETRASAAVGVAISVTTIPASAYLGVALGTGEAPHALGALLVLTVNVALLIISATIALALQRLAVSRAERAGTLSGRPRGRV